MLAVMSSWVILRYVYPVLEILQDRDLHQLGEAREQEAAPEMWAQISKASLHSNHIILLMKEGRRCFLPPHTGMQTVRKIFRLCSEELPREQKRLLKRSKAKS